MRLLIAAVFLLTGCATTQPSEVVKLPDLPAHLQVRATPLPKLIDPSMASQINDSVATDMKYNAVANQLNQVLAIYDCIKIADQKKDCLK
jgi:hypothetical protein